MSEHTTTTKPEARRGLGRGLDSLLPSSNAGRAPIATQPQPGEQIHQLSLDLIDHNPYQTRDRATINPEKIAELAASITANGVLQPIVVRPSSGGRYEIIAGERRVLASRHAEKKTIAAIVRQVSNEQALELTIIENLQREDLNPLEHARAFERLANEFGLTQEQIATRTGKDRATIANYVRLLRLPEMIQVDVLQDKMSFGHAKALLMLTSAELMETAARRIKEEGLSVRQTEQLVDHMMHGVELGQGVHPKVARVVDPNVRQAERELQTSLGCRVQIKDRQGRGKIVIEYQTLEDFDRVVEMLGRK